MIPLLTEADFKLKLLNPHAGLLNPSTSLTCCFLFYKSSQVRKLTSELGCERRPRTRDPISCVVVTPQNTIQP